MKPSGKAVIALSFSLALMAGPLFADAYNFDENGVFTYSDVFGTYWQGTGLSELAPDPSGGITNSLVLIFNTGNSLAPGDVALMKPGQVAISKLLRFTADGDVIYYSQPDGTLAGVGIPYSTSPVQISETDPFTTWIPATTNQPGYNLNGAFPVFYSGTQYGIHAESPAPPPALSGTNLLWHYAGLPDSPFFVMAATNLSLPPANWSYVSTNGFDSSGNCLLTLPIQPDKPGLFYRVAWPPVVKDY